MLSVCSVDRERGERMKAFELYQLPEGFEKRTQVRLPYDLREHDCGIHGLEVWFILIGPLGAVQFAATFGVYLPGLAGYSAGKITGFDVGYHSPTPKYQGQESMECELLPGGRCFYDGSSLAAEKWTEEIFSTRGDLPENVLWRKLFELYQETFEGGKQDYD